MNIARFPRRTAVEATKITLEVAGLMVKPEQQHSSRHTLLRPVNLRLVHGPDLPDWTGHDVDDPLVREDEYLLWDSLEPDDVDSGSTWGLLWALLRLRNPEAEDVRAFTEKWGMLSSAWDYTGYGDSFRDMYGEFPPGLVSLEEWQSFAMFVHRLVTVLVLTAQDELIDIELLEEIADWDELPPSTVAIPTNEELDAMSSEELSKFASEARESPWLRMQQRKENLLSERKQGFGLRQQRRLLANKLNELLGMQYARFSWDDGGRRMDREADGLEGIAFSHIATLFLSPEVDVLVCSVCGAPFPFDENSQGRRPRFGVRRFCSDTCRQAGKRESNRLSWRRNSARWRRKPSSPESRGKEENDGQEG